RQRRSLQARRLGRIRREPGGSAGLREDLWGSPEIAAIVDIVGRQYRRHLARRRRGDFWRQRGDGLWHRRRAGGAEPDRAVRRQGRANRLRAEPGGAANGTRPASRNRRGARTGLCVPVARNLAGAERPDRGGRRGWRRGRGRLPQIEALPAVNMSGPAAPAIVARGWSPALRLHNHVLSLLVVVAAIAVAATGFVAIAPNRLVSGQPVALWPAADPRLGAAIALL